MQNRTETLKGQPPHSYRRKKEFHKKIRLSIQMSELAMTLPYDEVTRKRDVELELEHESS